MNESLVWLLCAAPDDELWNPWMWAVSGPLSLLFALLSTWGNVVSLEILRTLSIRRSVRFYLSVLAVANASISQCTLWYYALGETLRPFFGVIDVFQLLTVFLHPVSSFSMTTTIWMILAVTGDRYFALKYPFEHRARESRHRARNTTCLILLAAVAFSIPTAFELKLSYECDAFTDEPSKLRVLPTALRLNDDYLWVYQLLLTSVFIYVGPLLVITFFTLSMIFIVYAASTQRSGMDARKKDSKSGSENTTIMLLIVVIKFLICNSPSMLLNVWEKIEGSANIAGSEAFHWCVELSNLLVVVNSASDSIVYLRWRKRHNPQHNVYTTNLNNAIFTADEAAHIQTRFKQGCTGIGFRVANCLLASNDSNVLSLEAERIESTLTMMIKSIGDPIAEGLMLQQLRKIGARHTGETISARQWNHYKALIIKEYSDGDDQRLWSRFACVLIKEFRYGQNHYSEKSLTASVCRSGMEKSFC